MRSSFLLLIPAAVAAACSTPAGVVYYEITSQSKYQCCRTLRYSTREFPRQQPSSATDTGFTVRLTSSSSTADCAGDLHLNVILANNTDGDLFVPVSYELSADTLRLFPFRAGWDRGERVRIARQLQYGDIVDTTVPRLTFYRLGSRREVRLAGLVPHRWLCSTPIVVSQEYLDHEWSNTTFFVDRSRAIGTIPYRRDSVLTDTLRLRFDVAYTDLEFYRPFPVLEKAVSRQSDSLSLHIAVDDEPKNLLDASQHLAISNVMRLKLQ